MIGDKKTWLVVAIILFWVDLALLMSVVWYGAIKGMHEHIASAWVFTISVIAIFVALCGCVYDELRKKETKQR